MASASPRKFLALSVIGLVIGLGLGGGLAFADAPAASAAAPTSVQPQSAADKAAADKPRILLFGDSITWGYIPSPQGTTERYHFHQRWSGALQDALGDSFTIVEEGLNARTAGADDYVAGVDASIKEYANLNGKLALLPLLRTHDPLDLVVIFLGTNDTRVYNKQSLADIRASIATLIKITKVGAFKGREPKILLMAPPPGQPAQAERFNKVFAGSYELASQLGKAYKEIAEQEEVYFLDAAELFPVVNSADGIHLTAEDNIKLGKFVAEKVKTIFAK
ncbi:MAG: GDSL-type esterase/lipase family protein [Planctomycetota bacterium]|jgi:lysophospholipase L1-like esterase|nr:GDSL-type esterase/lipase family protein [Planctomycetota bacterium]